MTMWTTVSARIRGAKQELEDAGEDTDGLVESTSKLRSLVKGLTGFDIMADKAGTQFKDIYDIVLGIGKEWKNLTDIEQAGLLEALAGKRQSNALAAVFGNLDTLEASYQTSLGASNVGGGIGSAQQELENYQKGIEYSIGRFKAAFQELATTAIDSDLVKGLVDGGTKVLEILTAIIDKVGTLQGVLAGFTGFVALKTFFKGFETFKTVGTLNSLFSASGTQNISGMANAIGHLSDSAKIAVVQMSKLDDQTKVDILGAWLKGGDDAARAALGITQVGTAAQGASLGVATLGDKLKGVGVALKTFAVEHPFLIAAAAITAVIAAITTYQKHLEKVRAEERKAAQESYDAWKQDDDALQGQIDKVTELRTAIESGDLSDSEIIDAKNQILDIQTQIVDKYGEQASNIDLVNGKLETQKGILNDISNSKGLEVYNQNADVYERSITAMEKQSTRSLGTFSDLTGGTVGDDFAKRITEKYGSRGVSVGMEELLSGTKVYSINIDDKDVVETEGLVTELLGELNAMQEMDPGDEIFGDVRQGAKDVLKEVQGIISENSDLANQGYIGRIMFGTGKNLEYTAQSNGETRTLPKWYTDYADAVNAYNDALASGDPAKIVEARSAFEGIDAVIKDIVNDSSLSKYAEPFIQVGEMLDEQKVSVQELKDAWDGTISTRNAKELKTAAKTLRDSGLAGDELKLLFRDPTSTFANHTVEEVNKAKDSFSELYEWARSHDIVIDNNLNGVIDDIEIQPLLDLLNELGIVAYDTADQAVEAAEEAANGAKVVAVSYDEAKATFDETAESAKNCASAISTMNGLISGQATGKDVDVSFFDTEGMKEYASALEYVNGTIQLNTEKVREMNKAKAEEQIAANNAAKAQNIATYRENEREIMRLTAALAKLDEADPAYGNTLDRINALTSQNEELANETAILDAYSSSLRNATGTYQAWLDARAGGSKGDMAKDVRTAMSDIEAVFDPNNSEMYQRFGNETYMAAVDFLIPEEVSDDGAEAIQKYAADLKTYFTGDKTGVDKFIGEAIDHGLMDYDPDTGSLKVAANKTMEDFATAFNWTPEVMQAMFGDVETFIPDLKFDWSDEFEVGIQGVKDAVSRVNSADSGLKINFDLSNIETVEGKVTNIDAQIKRLSEYQATLKVDSDEYSDCQIVMAELVRERQELTKPAIMRLNFDAGGLDGVSTGMQDALAKLQAFQTAKNDLDVQASVGMDTTNAQASLDSITSQINDLSPEIKASIGLSEEGTLTAEDITEAIGDIDIEALVKWGVDETAIQDYNPKEKEAKVKYGVDDSAVKSFTPGDKTAYVNFNANTTPFYQVWNSFNPTKTVYVDVVERKKKATGTANEAAVASGTARAFGTAKASGDWGVKDPGVTLVGELGRELIVNPHDGTWHTVGDNGAEFVNIPKNAIVFNHKQTEALLERGWVFGRGSAMASGSALVTSSTAKWRPTTTSSSSSSGGSSSSSSKSNTRATNNNTAAQNKNTNATTKNTKAKNNETSVAKKMADMYDWVAVRLTYFANKTKAIADKINEYITSAFKQRLLGQQWGASRKEQSANYKAAALYLEQASNVARSTGMTGGMIQKAQTGAWQFETMSDATKEKYDAYLQYYDKYVEATQKIRDLRNEQLKLYADWANMPTEAAERKISKFTAAIEGLRGAYDTVASGGSATAVLGRITNRYFQNDLAPYQNAVNTARNKRLKTLANVDKANANLKKATSTLSQMKNALKGGIANNKNRIPVAVQRKIYTAISNGTKISLTNAELKTIPSAVRKQITNYNNAITTQQKASKAVTSAKSKDSTAATALREAKDRLASIKATQTQAQQIARTNRNAVSYVTQNALLDNEVKEQKKTMDAYNAALKQASNNVVKAQKQQATADKQLKTAQNAALKKGSSILKNSSWKKQLTASQQKALANGGTVLTNNIKDSNLLTALRQYNLLVSDAQNKSAVATDSALNYATALEAQSTAMQNLATAEQEYVRMRVEAEQEKFNNIKTYYESEIEYLNTIANAREEDRKMKDVYGTETVEADWQKQINALTQVQNALREEREKLYAQLSSAFNDKTIIKNTEEWWEMKNAVAAVDSQINEVETQIYELQDEMRNEVFYRALDKALTKAEDLRGAISTINDLINDDMMFDEDGKMTDFGITALATDIREYESSLDTLETLLAKRDKMIKAYGNGNNSTHYSQQEFEEDMRNITEEIQDALQDTDSLRSAITDMIAKTAKAELDATLKVIDARKKLLSTTKDYYEYDQQMKDKTKNLQYLDQQLAAIEGIDDAETKAMRRRLEAQREQAQKDIDETVRDHTYNLQVEGLDDLKTQLQDNYDSYVKDLNSNLEIIVGAVDNATDAINSSLSTVTQTVKELLDSYGVSGLTAETVGVPHFASGSKRVGRKTWGQTNEAGGEIVVTSKGVFMPLSANSAVVPANLTNNLFDLAKNYSNIIGAVSGKEVGTIAPVINCPVTINGNNIDENGVIRAINKQLPVISRKVQDDIRRDLNTFS